MALSTLDRPAELQRFRQARARSRALFSLLTDEAYYARPIALRNPVVFYEGHLPAFAVNTLLKRGLGEPGIDAHLETIFARGIDPDDEANAIARGNPAWPSREVVRQYCDEADRRLQAAILEAPIERPDHPLLAEAQALRAVLEHEEMHQETLAYIWHQAPYAWKRKPEHYVTAPPRLRETPPAPGAIEIPGGTVTLGTPDAEPFAWDNERPAHRVPVEAFRMDRYKVTNAAFREFIEAGGYRDARWWRAEDWAWIVAERVTCPPFWTPTDDGSDWRIRGLFEEVPFQPSWPVYATWAEAHAYARFRGQRLQTEAEFHRAAYGTPDGHERRYPWGDELPHRAPANFDFLRWDPEPVDARPAAASAWGVEGLVGNGWEWTADVFAPFAGFTPLPSYPEYSAEFFDGEHYVMKGASPVTPRALVRPGFRNWFRPRYPYVYATFRCVTSA